MMQNEQIVQAYDELDLTPEQIAEQFPPLDVVAVKACLMQFSQKYRKDSDRTIDLNFSDKELQAANETILRLMRYSEDEHLQFKCAKYIRDDKKGRLDIGKNLQNLPINVIQFNMYLEQAKEALKISKSGDTQKVLPEAINV